MVNLKTAAVALIIILGTVGVVYAVTQFNIPVTGIITDSSLTVNPSALPLGTLQRGETVTRTLNITNRSLQSTAPLNLTSGNAVGVFTWNIETLSLPAGSSINATVTFTVNQNATVGPFEFPIYIVG